VSPSIIIKSYVLLSSRMSSYQVVCPLIKSYVLLNDGGRLNTASLPESWAQYPDMREISLSGCGLLGGLPGSWSALSKLKRLDLSDNLLGGGLPAEWCQLLSLRNLDLSLRKAGVAIKLSGSLPGEWESLGRLSVLDLWNQGVSGDTSAPILLYGTAEILLRRCKCS
jgi:hypothetical protein